MNHFLGRFIWDDGALVGVDAVVSGATDTHIVGIDDAEDAAEPREGVAAIVTLEPINVTDTVTARWDTIEQVEGFLGDTEELFGVTDYATHAAIVTGGPPFFTFIGVRWGEDDEFLVSEDFDKEWFGFVWHNGYWLLE